MCLWSWYFIVLNGQPNIHVIKWKCHFLKLRHNRSHSMALINSFLVALALLGLISYSVLLTVCLPNRPSIHTVFYRNNCQSDAHITKPGPPLSSLLNPSTVVDTLSCACRAMTFQLDYNRLVCTFKNVSAWNNEVHGSSDFTHLNLYSPKRILFCPFAEKCWAHYTCELAHALPLISFNV